MNCCLKEILYIRIMISNVTKTPPLKETIFDEGQENSPLFIYTGRLHNICVRGLESKFLMILNVCWYVIFISGIKKLILICRSAFMPHY